MAAGDVTFKVLYDGPADKVTIDAATASGASVVDSANKKIVAVATSTNHVLIIQVLIATA